MNRKLLVALAIVSLITAACGATQTGPSGSQTPAASEPSPNQGSDDSLQRIEERGQVEVFTEAKFPPFEFVDESGEVVGLDIDLMTTIFEEDLGVTVQINDISFTGLLQSLEGEDADLVWAGLAMTPERCEQFAFSIPYYRYASTVLASASDESVASPEDLSGQRVGVLIAGFNEDALIVLSDEMVAEGRDPIEIVRYESVPVSIEDLLVGRIAAMVNDDRVLADAMEKNPGELKMAGSFGAITYAGVTFKKDDVALREYVNQKLEEFKSDGTLGELQMEWLGVDVVDELPESVDGCTT